MQDVRVLPMIWPVDQTAKK